MTRTRTRTRLRSVVAGLAGLAALALVATGPVAAVAAPASTAAPSRGGSAQRLADLGTEDPGTLGPDAVDELSYDLGDQAFQPEGFPAKVELKAAVYAPQVITGAAPLVVLLHGRHATCADATTAQLEWPCPASLPEVPSYLGYGTLGHTLASHGVVVVSISANGINANDDYLADGGASARAQLVLQHLKLWKAWNASATGSPFGDRFVGHVDLGDVGLMGHSRGGEGVVAAAQLDQSTGSPFGIKAVLALAPVDFGHRSLGGVPLDVVLPYCDGDVSDLQGVDYYDASRYANPGDPAPKATTVLYGANHNFFNTVWTSGPGSFDDAGGGEQVPAAAGAPDACRPGGTGRLAAPVQEQAGATIMAGFFRRYLQDDVDLQRFVTGTAPFPPSAGPARWSVAYQAPDRLDVERFDSAANVMTNRFGQLTVAPAASPGLVCNPFDAQEEDGSTPRGAVATTAACPAANRLSATNDTGVLEVGWDRPSAVVREPLAPAGTDASGYDGVRFRVAVLDDSRNAARALQGLSVVLEDTAGHRRAVSAAPTGNAFVPMVASETRHAVLDGVRVPLASFTGVDLTHLRAVELRFDRTDAGLLSIADLAFTQEGTGTATGPTAGMPAVSQPRPPCRRTPAVRWGCTLAHVAWGRDPSPDELAWLAAGYPSAAGRRRVIARVVATRSMAALHELRFGERYSGTDVTGGATAALLDAAGRAHWARGLVELASGLAYSSGQLGTAKGIVQSAYLALAGRPVDPSGLAYWTPRVDAGPVTPLAASLVASAGHRSAVVEERYQEILGRAPDPSGRAYWMGQLAEPDGEQAMVRALFATPAFLATASG